MTRQTFHVRMRSAALRQVNDRMVGRFRRQLAAERHVQAPAVSIDRATRTVAATMRLETATFWVAVQTAVEAFERAARALRISGFEVIEVSMDQGPGGEERHELVSAGEVAHRLGLSRERVRQLTEIAGGFPAVAATVGGYRIWRWSDVRRWADLNDRFVGPARGGVE